MMEKEKYKDNLLNPNISSTEYILEMVSDTNWYLCEREHIDIFTENALKLIATNIDNMEKDDIISIMQKMPYFEISDESFLNKLMQKSIEYNTPILTSYHTCFDIFTEQQKIDYVKILNDQNYYDFSFFKYRFSKSNGQEKLCNIYKEHFFKNDNDNREVNIPCENFNLFIIGAEPILLLNNQLIEHSHKEKIFKKLLESDESGICLWSLFRLIESKKVDFIKLNLMDLIIAKVGLPSSSYRIKNNLIEFFDVLQDKELVDYVAEKIIFQKDLKQGFLKILSQKINNINDYDIRNFSNPLKEHTNMNFLQYLIFNTKINQNKPLIIELCKKDRDFMNLLNNCLHENVNGFNYEKSPLDLALQNIIKFTPIEKIYLHKIINNEVKPGLKDKVCAVLFKSIKDCDWDDNKRYMSLLNAISLMPTNLVNKYFNYHKETLPENRLDDIEKIKNMLNLKQSLGSENSNQINKPKVKL